MLGAAGGHTALVDERRRVERRAGGQACARRDAGAPVQVADDDREVAKPVGTQLLREVVQCRHRGVHEGGAQREILHRVAGEHHLGEYRDTRAGLGRPARPFGDETGVSVQVSDGGVDLCEGDP